MKPKSRCVSTGEDFDDELLKALLLAKLELLDVEEEIISLWVHNPAHNPVNVLRGKKWVTYNEYVTIDFKKDNDLINILQSNVYYINWMESITTNRFRFMIPTDLK